MALSRLSNLQNDPTFSKIYVDPNNFDATDSIENRGTSPNRPFSSLQRAAIEAAMSSYVRGRNNDRNDRTTIVVSSGTHYIDNRPGFSIQKSGNTAVFKRRTGKNTWTADTINPLSTTSNFDIFDSNNDLYKYNSINGGIILPRGTSIVGQDLRKTKIRPLYVPDPLDPDVERSSILNVTGSCYFSTFTFFDADVTKFSYKNYTNSKNVPKYSHHKLTTFVYADGVTKVRLGLEQTDLTDLEMYYYKISHAYNLLSGRDIPDYPISLDFEPSIDEFRIVGASQENPLGISSIRAGNGDGTGDKSIITITTANLQTKVVTPHNFAVDTPIIISGITADPNSYNGSFTVREVVDVDTFTVITPVIPSSTTLPQALTFDNATVSVESDSVSSASPYIFNCSLRSVYGMCGMWADGAKAEGFKSMVVAQYTGISLQKDDDAYLIYDDKTFYESNDLKNNPNKSNLLPLHQNSRAIYKPEFENFHIRASNDAFIQCVSIFAIGFAKHFVTESGADMSITNSNSNFGANALNSVGFRKLSFDRDDVGYITHIIPPKELSSAEIELSWLPIDVEKIKTVSLTSSTRLYINEFTSLDTPPDAKVEDYRIGARLNDKIYLNIDENGVRTTYSAPICMTIPSGISDIVSKKEYKVSRTGNINNISADVITFTGSHKLHNGESIRIFADNGQAPDGLEVNKIYYAITTITTGSPLTSSQIKVASTLSDAIAETNISLTGIENNGGILTVVSSVTDKKSGDLGHPIQWDSTNNQWYLTVGQSNEIYSNRNTISNLNSTPITFIKRIEENRVLDDRIYKFRYVIPKEFEDAKPPQVGFVIEESKNVAPFDETVSINNSTEFRNERIIVNATTDSIVNGVQIATITTELPHRLIPGDVVKIQNITSSNNSSGVGIVSTYNGEYEVLSIPTSRTFTYQLENVRVNPGTFTNNINERVTQQERIALPLFSRNTYKNKFYIYGIDTIQNHLPGINGKDGIYHIQVLSASVDISPNVGYGLSQKSFRQDVRNLYPQVDRDNVNSNPTSTISYADLINVGRVITDDKRKSITLETVNEFNLNNRIGFGITNVVISGIGSTTVTLFTDVEHKLNSIKSISPVSGSGYSINSNFYSVNLINSSNIVTDATVKISTGSTGNINAVRVLDSGSAIGVGTFTLSNGNGVVNVSSINNHVGSGLELFNFQTTNINGIYEIISIPTSKSVVIHVPSGISTYTPNTSQKTPIGFLASNGVGISSVRLSNLQTGIATVTTSTAHGLVTGNKFKFINSNLSFYNKDFIVDRVVGINTFTFNVGIATTTQTPTTGKILKYGISSNGLSLESGENNLLSRGCFIYAGISTTLTTQLTLAEVQNIQVSNVTGFNQGDFILINNEILRIKTNPSGNTLEVLRSQLGTSKTTALSGTLVRKIKVIPTEVRRPSYMRASGHTFEYLGFGPGNYSTALPQRQDRILSEDEILVSQAKRESGGIIVYTGMNDLGEFFTGSKKSSTITNKETTIDAPIITFTGDDVDGGLDASADGTFDDVIVRNKILVEGSGSQFYGSVEFRNRLINNSIEGISAKNLYLKPRDNTPEIRSSSQNKLISVGSTTSSLSNPNSGDILILDEPSNYLGHTYKDNTWRPWGLVSLESNILNLRVDKLGINRSVGGSYILDVDGDARIKNLVVTDNVSIPANASFTGIIFDTLTVNGTATFTGITSNYTQIHQQGISKLNNLEVVGVSSFTGISTFNSRVDIDNLLVRKNINVGIANSNTISTENGNLILSSNSGVVNVNRELSVTSNQVSITTTRSSGIATAFITDSRLLRLGVGNTNQNSYIDLNNDSRVFSDYGLRIIRNSGIGSQSSSILHRGNQPLTINAIDNGAEVRIATNNIDRFVVSPEGTVTCIQNNNGQELDGAHFRINQRGTGDAVLSWDVSTGNQAPTHRWYCGIDTSDNHSWKLAYPTSLVYTDNDYNQDYKFRISKDSTLTLFNRIDGVSSKTLTLNQSQLTTSESSFNLLNTVANTINAFGAATNLTIGANGVGIATVRNDFFVLPNAITLIGSSTQTGTSGQRLQVFSGAYIRDNLGIGTISVASGYRLDVRGAANITGNTNVDGTVTAARFSGPITASSASITGVTTIGINTTSTVLTINQTGSGNALRINDKSNDTTPFIVDSNGSVGIATTAVASGYKLDVRGATNLVGNLNVASSNILTNSTSFNLLNTTATTINAFGDVITMNIGGTPTTAVTHNYSVNPTGVGSTKTINFGTGGIPGSTTNINIAPLDSLGTTTVGNNLTVRGRLQTSSNTSLASWTTNGIAFDSSSATFTNTSTGVGETIATQVTNSFRTPTFASTNAITVTNAANVYISNRPTAGENTTITNGHALYIANGRTFMEDAGSAAIPTLAIRTVNTGLYSSPTNTLSVTTGGTLAATFGSTGDLTIAGNLLTSSATASIFNTTATTINAFGAATNLTIGANSSGIATVRNDFFVLPNAITLIGSSTQTGTSGQRLQVFSGAYIRDNVGIGTTNPGTELDVDGTVRADRFTSTISTGTSPISVASSTRVNNLNVEFLDGRVAATSNTPNTIVRRDTDGDFTAGTITATTFNGELNSTRLDTSSSGVSITGVTTIGINTTSTVLTINQPGSGNALRVNDKSNDTTPFIVDSNGSVGIGVTVVTSGYKLVIDGAVNIGINSTTPALNITQTGSGDALRVNDISNDNTPFIVDSNGNVGIGTISVTSGYKLDVRGDAIVNGNITASGTVTANSDVKLKTNIKTIDNALNKVCELRGVEFDRKDSGEHQIGVIAQEVERIIPEVVYGNETKSVAYGNLVGLLIEAIKEQQKEIEELKKNSYKYM